MACRATKHLPYSLIIATSSVIPPDGVARLHRGYAEGDGVNRSKE